QGRGEGTRRLMPRPTLEVEQVRQLLAAVAGDDRGVHLDPGGARWVLPVQGDGDGVLVDPQIEHSAAAGGHGPSVLGPGKVETCKLLRYRDSPKLEEHRRCPPRSTPRTPPPGSA